MARCFPQMQLLPQPVVGVSRIASAYIKDERTYDRERTRFGCTGMTYFHIFGGSPLTRPTRRNPVVFQKVLPF